MAALRLPRSTAPAALALMLAFAAGCSSDTDTAGSNSTSAAAPTQTSAGAEAGSADAILARHGLEGKDTRAIIDELDRTHADRDAGLMASVRQDTLVLKDDSGEATLPMPADVTYVSIAPFVNQTHECFFHSLATCQGEMVNTPVTLKFTDASGKVIAQESDTTYANGFVGLWLPRNVSGTMAITANGKSATAPLATGADDPTCVTTIKLA